MGRLLAESDPKRAKPRVAPKPLAWLPFQMLLHRSDRQELSAPRQLQLGLSAPLRVAIESWRLWSTEKPKVLAHSPLERQSLEK